MDPSIAQRIKGIKKPSPAQTKRILQGVQQIGRELSEVYPLKRAAMLLKDHFFLLHAAIFPSEAENVYAPVEFRHIQGQIALFMILAVE